jgi:predicted DNA-binding transcriptional regulator YafY
LFNEEVAMSFKKAKAVIKLGIMLQEGEHLSRRKIEKQLNVSSSTVHHYIDDLRKHFNAPIVYDNINNYYYCSKQWSIMDELVG